MTRGELMQARMRDEKNLGNGTSVGGAASNQDPDRTDFCAFAENENFTLPNVNRRKNAKQVPARFRSPLVGATFANGPST
jgi:hypothetical protein